MKNDPTDVDPTTGNWEKPKRAPKAKKPEPAAIKMTFKKKMSFGEWVGAAVKGNAGGTLVRVDGGYFKVEALQRIAASIDSAVFMAQMESRKLSPLEGFAMEVLFQMAQWQTLDEARESYKRYLASLE